MSKYNSTTFINGVKWYKYFVSNPRYVCLLDEVPNAVDRFNVCLCAGKAERVSRWYHSFDSAQAFYKHISGIPKEYWYYHEYIMGDQPQKMAFDIDMKTEGLVNPKHQYEWLLSELVKACINVYRESCGVTITPEANFLVYTSHGSQKQSAHVIIDGYVLSNHIQRQILAQSIIAELSGVVKGCEEWLDMAIYNKGHQLRLPGSRKNGSSRVKTFQPRWGYNGSIITHTPEYDFNMFPDQEKKRLVAAHEFLHGCITYSAGCDYISVPEPPDVQHETTYITDAMYATLKPTPTISKLKSQFVFEKRQGDMIRLTRLVPSHCIICDVVHEKDNAYLKILPNGNVLYGCYGRNRHGYKAIPVVSNIVLDQDVSQYGFHTNELFLNALHGNYG